MESNDKKSATAAELGQALFDALQRSRAAPPPVKPVTPEVAAAVEEYRNITGDLKTLGLNQ